MDKGQRLIWTIGTQEKNEVSYCVPINKVIGRKLSSIICGGFLY